MASIHTPNHFVHRSSISHHLLLLLSPPSSSSSLSFSQCNLKLSRCSAVKTSSESGGFRSSRRDGLSSEILRKPAVTAELESDGEDEVEKKSGDGQSFVDWEDQILEDTVPLVGFVRMILHSGKYGVGDRLSPEHQSTILQRLLPHHPECEKKIGCGVDYIIVGNHPNFDSSKCLFIVRKDGEMEDFSYWKCIKGLVRKNYPLYADTFVLRHFRKRQRED